MIHEFKSGFSRCRLNLLMLVFAGLFVSPPIIAQWKPANTESFRRAMDNQDWSAVDKKVRKLIKQWTYLDTSLGYPNYSRAIDSLVGIFKEMPCVEDAFADKCAIKIAIWPGTSIVGVNYRLQDSIYEFCYAIQEGKMRAIRINGILHIPLKGKEKLIYLGSVRCEGFIEEQHKLCEEHLQGL